MDKETLNRIEALEAEMHIELGLYLLAVRADARTYDPSDLMDDPDDPDCEPTIDVRIQVLAGYDNYFSRVNLPSYSFYSGDSQFDSDGRGFWGCSSVSPNDDSRTLAEIAMDMINQAIDMAHECAQ